MKKLKLGLLILLIFWLCSFTRIYYDQGTYNEVTTTEEYVLRVIMYERLNGIQMTVEPPYFKEVALSRLKEIAPNHSIKKMEIRDKKYLWILASVDGKEIKEKE